MVIIVNKETTRKQLRQALKTLNENRGKPKLSDFFGKGKSCFGDGLQYQLDCRADWDK